MNNRICKSCTSFIAGCLCFAFEPASFCFSQQGYTVKFQKFILENAVIDNANTHSFHNARLT